jgi:hypothetical protein
MIIAGIAGFIVSEIAAEFYTSLTQNDLLRLACYLYSDLLGSSTFEDGSRFYN